MRLLKKNIIKNKNEDIYISILKFAKEKEFEGFSYNDIYQLARERGYLSKEELNEIEKNKESHVNVITEVTKNKRVKLDAMFAETTNTHSGCTDEKRIMSFESYFKLIEHEELSEARRNAKIASWLAMTAIMISAISITISSDPVEIKNSIRLDNQQLEEIKNSKNNINKLENKLNIIINNQEENIELNKKNSIFSEEIK